MNNIALIGINSHRELGPEAAIAQIQKDYDCTYEVARISYWVNCLMTDLLKMSEVAFQLVQQLPSEEGTLSPYARICVFMLTLAGSKSQDSADGLREVVMDLMIENADVDEFISSIFPDAD